MDSPGADLQARAEPHWTQEPKIEPLGKRSLEVRDEPRWVQEPKIEHAGKRDLLESRTLEKRKSGRYCDFGKRIYEDFGYLKTQFSWYCGKVNGLKVPKGDKLSAILQLTTGQSELYIKYQNDHADYWYIRYGECYDTLTNIMVGCTPAGANPTNGKDQKSDGGTYYIPNLGSLDFQNR
ncbi:hypothetical protein MMC16_001495 [Acarospora aff. strigata]|nr:hypothetical protein [Acarospora aff. strigata]